jgi:hypothetical protein
MSSIDRERLGTSIQASIDSVAAAAGRDAWRALALGVGLALIVIGGGLAALLIVWAVLVGLLN